MFKILNSIEVFISIIVILSCSSSAETLLEAYRAGSSPVIDGKLTDPCWQKAKPITNFITSGAKTPARFQTTGYVLYDDAKLYLGIKCNEPDIGNIKTISRNRDDKDILLDDHVEILIDPWLSKEKYFQFSINASGSQFDCFYAYQGEAVLQEEWDGDWKARSFIGEGYWSCEVCIPFYTLAITPATTSDWGINLCRMKKEPSEYSAIIEGSAFNLTGKFAELQELDVDFKDYFYRIGDSEISIEIKDKRLNVEIKAPVKNDADKEKKIKFECWLVDPSGEVSIKSQTLTLKSGEEKTCSFDNLKLTAPGEYKADYYLTISDVDSERILALSRRKMPIKYLPIAINIIKPFYRNTIFFSQNLEKVVLEVEISLTAKELKKNKLYVEINDKHTSQLVIEKTVTSPAPITRVEFPNNDKFPGGDFIVSATLKDKNKKVITHTKCSLNKLSYKKGEVWLDEDLNWHIDDGKPFFPVGHWGSKYGKNPYFNLYVQLKELSASEQERGIKRSAFSTASGNWYPDLRKEKGKINDTIITRLKEIVRQEKDKPDLFCYFLCDEPDMGNIPVENLKMLYDAIREEDPYHPVWINCNRILGARNYSDCADFISLDIYPFFSKEKKINDCFEIPLRIDDFLRFTKHKKPVGFMHQGFNYSDEGQGSRAPTYIELRGQNLLALTVGAKSIIQFNLDPGFGDYPEYDIGIPHLAQELAYLGKVVTAPVSKLEVKTSSDKVRTLLKDVQGELYLFAVNADSTLKDVRISIPGISERAKNLNVIPEARAVGIKEDSFSDKFDTFEAHVYTTSNEETGLMSVAEVCKKIEAAQQARKKPGNLAFQMYRNDGVVVTASSKTSGRRGELWHVVDGITTGRSGWYDTTKDEYPDWIEIKLPEAHSIGRVVVYPYNKSLKDYSVQAFVTGEWKEVDKISGNDKEMITHKFGPVVTDKIRLWITAANGTDSKIAEIEIYEK